MLSSLYLATTGISWAIIFIYTAALYGRVKREGYKLAKNEKSIPERIATIISNSLIMSMPVLNIVYASKLILYGENILDDAMDELIKNDKIIKVKEETKNNEDGTIEVPYEITENSKEESVLNKKDTMSTKEKIDSLKETKEELLNSKKKTKIHVGVREVQKRKIK